MPLENTSDNMSKQSTYRFTESSDQLILYEELRLIERNDNEINAIWKGAHMVLFFMAFVFGIFCTCCFHMLMHMFDKKCVLYPKVASHSSISQIVYEFFSIKTEIIEDEPEYVTTQWSENSVCYLPTYVPLVSGLAGLVWTTMFLMCSSGTSNVTGTQRYWRALPLMFLFSTAMSGLCIYASAYTQSGLRDLCSKLAEVTGTEQSSYTLNVVTLAYEYRIRGVFQATRFSIVSAWLHTTCWVLSALLIVARVLLAVDFTLVYVKAQLIGDMDYLLQMYEQQVDSIDAEYAETLKRTDIDESDSEVELFVQSQINIYNNTLDSEKVKQSKFGLVAEEKKQLFSQIVKMILNSIVDNIDLDSKIPSVLTDAERLDASKKVLDPNESEKSTKQFVQRLSAILAQVINELDHQIQSSLKTVDDEETEAKDKSRKEREGKHEDNEETGENRKVGRKLTGIRLFDHPMSTRKRVKIYEEELERNESDKIEVQHKNTSQSNQSASTSKQDSEPNTDDKEAEKNAIQDKKEKMYSKTHYGIDDTNPSIINILLPYSDETDNDYDKAASDNDKLDKTRKKKEDKEKEDENNKDEDKKNEENKDEDKKNEDKKDEDKKDEDKKDEDKKDEDKKDEDKKDEDKKTDDNDKNGKKDPKNPDLQGP